MRSFLIAAVALPLWCCSPAFAQVEDALTDPQATMPSLGATSPLGIGAAGSVGATGVPLGSTELMSLGVSPVPTGITGTITIPTTSTGTACSTAATSPSQMFGSAASLDGGGMKAGTPPPATAVTSGTAATS